MLLPPKKELIFVGPGAQALHPGIYIFQLPGLVTADPGREKTSQVLQSDYIETVCVRSDVFLQCGTGSIVDMTLRKGT